MSVVSYKSVLTHVKPEKSLVFGVKRSVGRNNAGRITVRHKGGGHKRLMSDVDFKTLIAEFVAPPREFSPAPIWWWSGEKLEASRLRFQM